MPRVHKVQARGWDQIRPIPLLLFLSIATFAGVAKGMGSRVTMIGELVWVREGQSGTKVGGRDLHRAVGTLKRQVSVKPDP